VVIMANNMFRGLPHQPDGQHLTPQGYHLLAAAIAPRVTGFVGR
jgi:acyl-CoA thioesterase-1